MEYYQMTMELDSRLEIRMSILKDSILEKSLRIRPISQNSLILEMLSFTIDECRKAVDKIDKWTYITFKSLHEVSRSFSKE